MKNTRLALAALTLLAVAVVVACHAARSAPTVPLRQEPEALLGCTADEVREKWGEPKAVVVFRSDFEAWEYETAAFYLKGGEVDCYRVISPESCESIEPPKD